MRSDQRRKGGHRRRVTGFKLGEGFGILLGRGTSERGLRQRFVSAQRLTPPAQHQIADRPATKLFGAVGNGGADANAGAEKLVGGLEPCRGVDGVTIGGVVEEAAAAKIADQRGAGMDAKAGGAEIDALGLPARTELLGPSVEIMRTGDYARRIIRLVPRSVEKNMNGVPDDLCDRAFMREN